MDSAFQLCLEVLLQTPTQPLALHPFCCLLWPLIFRAGHLWAVDRLSEGRENLANSAD